MKVSSALLNGHPVPSPVRGLVHALAKQSSLVELRTVVAVSEGRQFAAGVVTHVDEQEVQMFSLVERWPSTPLQELILLRDAYILSLVSDSMSGDRSYSFAGASAEIVASEAGEISFAWQHSYQDFYNATPNIIWFGEENQRVNYLRQRGVDVNVFAGCGDSLPQVGVEVAFIPARVPYTVELLDGQEQVLAQKMPYEVFNCDFPVDAWQSRLVELDDSNSELTVQVRDEDAVVWAEKFSPYMEGDGRMPASHVRLSVSWRGQSKLTLERRGIGLPWTKVVPIWDYPVWAD